MKQKILIIDDEIDFCEIMKNYFVKRGYDVSIANTLSEGLDTLRQNSPDILFLDNNLPDGNGWDAVGNIVETIPRIRAYLISAHRNKSTIDQSNNNVIVWEKPISIETLNSIF